MEANPILLQKKYAGVVKAFAKRRELVLEENWISFINLQYTRI